MPSPDLPFAGRSIVVTRAAEQGERLVTSLRSLGAEVVELPLIQVVDAADGGADLASALAEPSRYDWLVVTSPNGAARVAATLGARRPAHVRIAAVGEATSGALGSTGPADVVAERAIAEGLLDALTPSGPARALVVQGDRARSTIVDGLRQRGWTVRQVVAYRTVAAEPPAERLTAALTADAITFASGSTVESFVAAAGTDRHPPVVVSIGPETTAAAERVGLPVTTTADPHTLEGLVAALRSALAREP